MDIDELKGNTADLAGALNDLSDQVGEPPRPLLILQGNALIPFQCYKGMPSFPSNPPRVSFCADQVGDGPDTSEIEAKVASLSAEVADISIDVSLQNFAREAAMAP